MANEKPTTSAPAILDPALPIEDEDEQQRDHAGEKRGLVTDDGGNMRGGLRGKSRIPARDHGPGRRDGRRDGAVGHGRGVRQKHGEGGALGLDAQGQDHRGGDGDGRAEAGQGLEQAAEAEGYHHGLDADIAATYLVEEPAQVLRAAGDDRDLVEPHRHADDEHDGEGAEGGTLRGGHESEIRRHSEADDGNHHGDDERHERGEMRLGLHPQQHDEEGRQRNAGHQSR